MTSPAPLHYFCTPLCLACLLALMAGCTTDSTDNAPFTTYLDRLSRTLQTEQTTRLPRNYPRPPRTGQLQVSVASDSLDTLDFLSLSGCAVQITIGKRNSSLGRMARPSQRLLLELEYLRLAPDCVRQLQERGEEALAARLESAWHAKRQQLPARIFNATLGGEEFRAFWQASSGIGRYPPVDTATAAAALAAIDQLARQWLDGDYSADNPAFEILLSEVAGGGGGRLLKALSRQAEWLEVADILIDERMARQPLCADGLRPAAADVLPRVISRYFIEGIQARAAAMHKRYYQLMPPTAALEQLLAGAIPATYRDWALLRDERLEWATEAPRRHVLQLKKIQVPCELANPPGQSGYGMPSTGKIGYTATLSSHFYLHKESV